MVDVELLAVRVEMPSNAPVALVRERDGERRTVPIFIGLCEYQAIAYALDGVETPRPMTHDLMVGLLAEWGAELVAVEIVDLDSGTFYAELVLGGSDDEGERRVSCRPSDGLALAARVGCSIKCASSVVAEAGYVDADDLDAEVTDSDVVVEEFREFIEHVDPGDFAS